MACQNWSCFITILLMEFFDKDCINQTVTILAIIYDSYVTPFIYSYSLDSRKITS